MFSTMPYVTFCFIHKAKLFIKFIKYVKKLRTYTEPRPASWVLNFLIILSLISWFYVKSSRTMEQHVWGLMPWLTHGTHLAPVPTMVSPQSVPCLWHLPLYLCPVMASILCQGDNWVHQWGSPTWAILPHPRWGPGHGPGEDQHQTVPLESLIRARWWLSARRAGSATVC